MNRLAVCTLLGVLIGFGIMTAQASDDTSSAIAPPTMRGPGPVINPEGSQYMEEKKAAMEKQIPQHTKQGKHHSKKKHHGKKHHKKKQ
jgi:hypothetical protein